MSSPLDWVQEFPAAITVCDTTGVIQAMNDRSIQAFQDQGGAALIGTNLLDCHPEPSRTTVRQMLANQETNVYTTEKRGVRRMILQAPWYSAGKYAGLAEIVFEIPATMPHFVREG